MRAGRAGARRREQTRQLTALEKWEEISPLLADVDSDGRDDLVFSNQATVDADGDGDYSEDDTVTVHAALAGDSEFAEPEKVLDLGPRGDAVTGVGDFDGDGDDDLFRATNTFNSDYDTVTGVEVEAFLNEGGTFEAKRTTRLDEDVWGVGWFLAGDPDGDGADELVVTNGRAGAVGVVEYADDRFGQVEEWLGARIPLREWERTVLSNGAPSYEHALSDVDGDGDDDLVGTAIRRGLLVIGIAESDGTSFATFEEWGEVPCTGRECDQLTLVANVQPSIR